MRLYSSGGTPEARRSLLWSFCVSQSVTPPVLTRGGFNPPKSKPTPTNTKAGTRQKQTDESLYTLYQFKLVHEYLFTWGPWRHQRARDVTNRGGVQGGHFPPASHVPPSPPEAQAEPISFQFFGIRLMKRIMQTESAAIIPCVIWIKKSRVTTRKHITRAEIKRKIKVKLLFITETYMYPFFQLSGVHFNSSHGR